MSKTQETMPKLHASLVFSTVFFLGLTAVLPTLSFSQDRGRADAQAALQEVRVKIEREEKRLTSVQRKKEELEEKLTRLKADQEKLSQEKTGLSSRDIDLDARVRKLELAVNKGKEALKKQREELNRRVVAVYKMQRRAGAVDYLVASRSATDLMRRLGYLTRIASTDRVKLDKLATYVSGFEQEKEELQRAKSERATNLESIVRLERDLASKAEETASLVSELTTEEQAGEAALVKLRESGERFELALAKIMGGEEDAPTEPVLASSAGVSSVSVAPQLTTKTEEKVVEVVAPFEGEGLLGLKGKLGLPLVGGKLVQRYGKQKHDEFADLLFVKGLEFQAPGGSKVRAVADGKIALSQVLPGYGNVIILDHGQRHYTLYGRLASSFGKLGKVVKAGEELAVIGVPDKKGRNFYFELRIQGKPVNPIDYFKQRPADLP